LRATILISMNLTKGLNNRRCHDLRGQRFGILTPIDIDITRNRVYWRCKCDCGNEKSVAAKHLVGGKISSCGCGQYRRGKSNSCWKGYEDISGKYWETLKRNAKKRGIEFSISTSYVWDIFIKQDRKCTLTGLPLFFKTRSDYSDGTASLDRIDPNKGYVEGNVHWVDKKVNTIKWNLSLDNFLRTCKMVVKHRNL